MTMNEDLKIVVGSDSIKLIGNLDINTVSLLKEVIIDTELKNTKLIIDMSTLIMMDSSGLGSLIRLSRATKEKITLKNINAHIRAMIKVANCDELFNIED
jgi:anti-anti-sigma factor